MIKKIFFGHKVVLASGREVELNCDQESDEKVSMIAFFNHKDIIHNIVKPMSFRMEWILTSRAINNIIDPVVSIECRGGSPGDRPVSEAEMPIDGLNGSELHLTLNEMIEIQNTMIEAFAKIQSELLIKV